MVWSKAQYYSIRNIEILIKMLPIPESQPHKRMKTQRWAPNVASLSPPTERFATDMVVRIDHFPITSACPTRQYLKSQWTHNTHKLYVESFLLGQCVLHINRVKLVFPLLLLSMLTPCNDTKEFYKFDSYKL